MFLLFDTQTPKTLVCFENDLKYTILDLNVLSSHFVAFFLYFQA